MGTGRMRCRGGGELAAGRGIEYAYPAEGYDEEEVVGEVEVGWVLY